MANATPTRFEKATDTELAWAAGFFDGEGCTTAVSRAPSGGFRFQSQVCQVELAVLERFKTAVGVGRIYGPYSRPNRQDHYRFQTASFEDTQAMIALLWKWLSEPKRQQAKRVLLKVLAFYKESKL